MKLGRLTCLVLLALTSCVPSWNAFYTDKDLIFEEALIGVWTPTDGGAEAKEAWDFSRGGDKWYRLLQTDAEGRQAQFEARLFKLGELQFLDLYLARVDDKDMKMNSLAGSALIPAHLLVKVDKIKPTLKFSAMNPDWMQKYLKQNPNAIAHRVVMDDNIVLAASTAELQNFVREHAGDHDFFGEGTEMKRKNIRSP